MGKLLMPAAPEQQARETIDAMLAAAGWAVQDYKAFDPSVSLGIALREVPLKSGRCDYLLLADRKPVGVVEAKKEGTKLSSVADRSACYTQSLPDFFCKPPRLRDILISQESNFIIIYQCTK